MIRLSWDEYFLAIAGAVALRSDCTRRQVGAVLVGPDRRIISTGYNGSPPGQPGCSDAPCPRSVSDLPSGSSYDTGPGACIALHAEMNALLYADPARWHNAHIYINCLPCEGCRKHLRACGIDWTCPEILSEIGHA